jgi:hypothetical protein
MEFYNVGLRSGRIFMSYNFAVEKRAGSRFVVTLPVRVEWDDRSGKHVVVEGTTENVGPEGALVHLRQLPGVGDRVQLAVMDENGPKVQVATEVLRLERNPIQPLAALQLVDSAEEWKGLVWEPVAQSLTINSEEITKDNPELDDVS